MGFRTLVELNHDYCPQDDDLVHWAECFRLYMRSGDKDHLPRGVTFKAMYNSYDIPEQIQKMGDPS